MTDWTPDIDPATIPDAVLASERGKRNASRRVTKSGGSTWSKHNAQVNNCKCARCMARRAKESK